MAGTSLKKADFPESVHGLLNKSKSDLLNIIARKDDVERRLTEENNTLKIQNGSLNKCIKEAQETITDNKKKIDELNNTVVEQSGVITNLNASVDKLNTSLSLSINTEDFNAVVEDNERVRKNFDCCFATLVIAVAIIVGLLIYFL